MSNNKMSASQEQIMQMYELVQTMEGMVNDVLERYKINQDFITFIADYSYLEIKDMTDEVLEVIFTKFPQLKECAEEEYNTEEDSEDMDAYYKSFILELYDTIINYIEVSIEYDDAVKNYKHASILKKYNMDNELMGLTVNGYFNDILNGNQREDDSRKFNLDFINASFRLSYLFDYLKEEGAVVRTVNNFFNHEKSTYLMMRLKTKMKRISKMDKSPINPRSMNIIFSRFLEETLLPEEYHCFNGLISYIFTNYVAYSKDGDRTVDCNILSFIRNLGILYEYNTMTDDNEQEEHMNAYNLFKNYCIHNFIDLIHIFEPYRMVFEAQNTLRPGTKERELIGKQRKVQDNTTTTDEDVADDTPTPVAIIKNVITSNPEIKDKYVKNIDEFERFRDNEGDKNEEDGTEDTE